MCLHECCLGCLQPLVTSGSRSVSAGEASRLRLCSPQIGCCLPFVSEVLLPYLSGSSARLIWLSPTDGGSGTTQTGPGAEAGRPYLGKVDPEREQKSRPGPRLASNWHVPEPGRQEEANPQAAPAAEKTRGPAPQFRENQATFFH